MATPDAPELVAPIWERQPGETPTAYEMFRTFRSIPLEQRTIAEAVRRRAADGLGGKARYAEHLHSRWRWADRARAHDSWVETIRRDERERGVRADERLRHAREEELLEMEYDLGMKMMRRAQTVIDLPVVKVQRDVLDEDGTTVHRTIVMPLQRASLRDAASLMLTADRRIRLALGLYGDPARHPTPEPGIEDTSDVDAWLAETTREPMAVQELEE